MTNSLAVIIPTYNARETIVETIRQIIAAVPNAEVFIIDDNSPDGTAKIVEADKKKNIHVLVRKEKGGRGSAVITGMKEALKDEKLQYFVEMDADLCHDPKYISQMVRACQHADMVIASKYIHGSTISGLSFKRKLLSKLMNTGARILLHVPVHDYSNGYRCYSRKVVAYLVKQTFRAKGFVVLSEILYLVHKKGFTIAEIPFDFIQHNRAESNLNWKEMREAFVTLLKLRFHLE